MTDVPVDYSPTRPPGRVNTNGSRPISSEWITPTRRPPRQSTTPAPNGCEVCLSALSWPRCEEDDPLFDPAARRGGGFSMTRDEELLHIDHVIDRQRPVSGSAPGEHRAGGALGARTLREQEGARLRSPAGRATRPRETPGAGADVTVWEAVTQFTSPRGAAAPPRAGRSHKLRGSISDMGCRRHGRAGAARDVLRARDHADASDLIWADERVDELVTDQFLRWNSCHLVRPAGAWHASAVCGGRSAPGRSHVRNVVTAR